MPFRILLMLGSSDANASQIPEHLLLERVPASVSLILVMSSSLLRTCMYELVRYLVSGGFYDNDASLRKDLLPPSFQLRLLTISDVLLSFFGTVWTTRLHMPDSTSNNCSMDLESMSCLVWFDDFSQTGEKIVLPQ